MYVVTKSVKGDPVRSMQMETPLTDELIGKLKLEDALVKLAGWLIDSYPAYAGVEFVSLSFRFLKEREDG